MKFKFFSISRIQILSLSILFFSIILISKLFLVQVVQSNTYLEKADRQYMSPSSGVFERGTIFFEYKNGELFSAATQVSGFKLAINPSKILNIENTYQQLSEIIELNEEDFLLKANKKDDPYEEIYNRLSKEEADKISSLKLNGISVFKERWRFYPGENMASHLIGFVGYQGDELGGRYGLEREYNDILSRNKNTPYVNFFAEVFSNINKTLFKNKTKTGNIVTTIEPNVQSFLEKNLKNLKEKYQIESIGGIIMHPQNGSIYAMTVQPDFNPNNFSDYKNVKVFSNPMVENVFEFGSVVKPLVMASALDTGVTKAETKYFDKGSIWVEKKEIFNFDKKGRGEVTMQEVLNQSLNTGMVFVSQRLGKENMRNYLLGFGLKEKTEIDLPNETSALMSNFLKSPREIEIANASFGQGIAFTPLELVRALASLGNGGYLVTPHLVKYIKYEDGSQEKIEYPTEPTKISADTSNEISRMLVNVMDKALKSGSAKMEHHSIALKTGTAQVANLEGGGYYENKHTHSFFGYFPAYDPQFIVFLYAIDPKGSPYAATTWADSFLEISKFLLNYYEVPPDR
jgi:stage V sporulation protein D (sporulation-specific penicillin-binding protein)